MIKVFAPSFLEYSSLISAETLHTGERFPNTAENKYKLQGWRYKTNVKNTL